MYCPGQGIVYETMGMSELPDYSTKVLELHLNCDRLTIFREPFILLQTIRLVLLPIRGQSSFIISIYDHHHMSTKNSPHKGTPAPLLTALMSAAL